MFCSECGTKNKEGSLFCESCGKKIEQPVKEKKQKQEKKSTKNGKLKYIIGAIVVVLIGAYLFLNNMTSPNSVAKGFFEAVMNADSNKLYSYIDVENSEFTTKKIFKNVVKDLKKTEIDNYTVEKPLISKDKLSATIKINYLETGKSDAKTATVKLIKDKSKKWLLFDNWKVNTEGYSAVKDFEFRVPKDSKLEIEGIKVKDKYLKKDSKDEDLDIYVIPSMFSAKYKVKVILENGLELDDEVNTGSYLKYYKAKGTLSSETEKTIEKASKKALEVIYAGAKDKKSWDDIKKTFEYKNGNVKNLKKAYESLLKSFESSSTTLTEIDFTEIEINSVSLTDDGQIKAYIKLSYDFTVSYQSGDETKTNESDDTDYAWLTFDYNNKEFKLVDAISLNTYFSKYY